MSETDFIQCALSNFANVWNATNVNRLATFDVPHNVLGRRRNLLKGDINEQWARWFTESLADPRRIAEKNITYPFLYEEVFCAVEKRFQADKTKPEIQQIASVTAKIILNLSNSIYAKRRRRALSFDERRLLLDISGSPARCWICGFAFKDQAIENFMGGLKGKVALPPFVDILKPRGLVERDFAIEVDHVLPFSKGGDDGDNLELACGWCNRYKSAHVSVYDVEGQPQLAGPNSLGIASLPQPFWIVRLLALVQTCEHPEGCDRSVKNTEMTIVPINMGGAMNPTNLRVICNEHDPFGIKRLQAPSLVKKIWNY